MTRHLLLASLLLAGPTFGQTPLINATFDGVSNDTNPCFQIVSNTRANSSGTSWNQTTGVVNRDTATRSTAGGGSTTTADIPAIGSEGSVVLRSIDGHLALKSPGGWKLIDSTAGGGNASSWDSRNAIIPDATVDLSAAS